jgi:hypothetical protein
MLRPACLSQKLDQPLPTKDGGTLRTIRDACDYNVMMPPDLKRLHKYMLDVEHIGIISVVAIQRRIPPGMLARSLTTPHPSQD